VPQENALFDHLNVRDNLRFWAAAYGFPWEPALDILRVGKSEQREFLKKKVKTLAGGMKKRLSIALACLHSPRYLIMDEPSAALDIGFKKSLADMLANIRGEGRCVVLTSHQPDELQSCDRIYVLSGGAFVYRGSPQGLGEDFTQALFGLTGGGHAFEN
jgi:ABC-2 type transport system ATP-binding protein